MKFEEIRKRLILINEEEIQKKIEYNER